MLLDYKKNPTVAALMRPFPYFAEPETSVTRIIQLMNDRQIRHIPIKKGDRIIGIVSERDLRWLKNPKLTLHTADEIPVCNIMTYDPYVADINTPLGTVVKEMSRQKIGAAIIMKSGRLAGIVTVIDICQAFAEVLNFEYSPAS